MEIEPFGGCTIDDDCPRGYICDGGVCVPDPGGGGGGGDPVDPLPGLANFTTKRYSSNVAVTEKMSCLDFLYDVLLPAHRGFIRQSQYGRLGIQIKKPVPFGFALTAANAGDSSITLDNVKAWVNTDNTLLLIAPHTDENQIVRVTAANYSTAQNSVTISTTGGLFSKTNFSGCDGANTPATASITVNSASATDCSITIDGVVISFTTSTSDTTVSIAAFIAGMVKAIPALNRRYEVSYVTGDSIVRLTARFGVLTLGQSLLFSYPAPLANPTTAPTLTASSSGSSLLAGDYAVAYSAINDEGETLLSKYKTVTLTAGQKIVVSNITLPSGATAVNWYVSPEKNSTNIRFLKSTNGTGFTIDGTTIKLPLLIDASPPDTNRTGVEVMKVAAVFSDRAEDRTSLGRSNVFKASFGWALGTSDKTTNVISLKYRRASEDFRLVTKKYKDKDNIAKVHGELPEEINGQAINNDDQADRIGLGLLAERQDANFFVKWKSVRDRDGGQVALLLQEGDVVAVTDDGQGVVNFPVFLEQINYDLSTASMPVPEFTGRKYSSALYGDSTATRSIPVISEAPVGS